MTDRFDNLSMDQLREALSESRAETKAIEDALVARLEAACPVRVGEIYKVRVDPDQSYSWLRRLSGRTVQVCFISAHRCGIGTDAPVELRVSVRPKLIGKKDTPTSDGFGRKHHWLDPSRLEPIIHR